MARQFTFDDRMKYCKSGSVILRRVSWQRRQQSMQRRYVRLIGDAVDTHRAEMALERGDDRFRRLVIHTRDFDAVPVERQHRLQCLNRLALLAAGEKPSAADRCRFGVMSDSGSLQLLPGK